MKSVQISTLKSNSRQVRFKKLVYNSYFLINNKLFALCGVLKLKLLENKTFFKAFMKKYQLSIICALETFHLNLFCLPSVVKILTSKRLKTTAAMTGLAG